MNNVHPIYNIKRLMLKQQLAKDPKLANENWERFLPKFKKTSEANKPKKQHKAIKPREKALFPPPPMPRKEDIAMMTGQAFFDKKDKKKDKPVVAAAKKDKQSRGNGEEGEERAEVPAKKHKKRAREEEGEQRPSTQHRTEAPSTLDARTAMEIANRLKGGAGAEPPPEPVKKLKGEPEKHLRMQQKAEMKKLQKKNKKDKKKSKKKK